MICTETFGNGARAAGPDIRIRPTTVVRRRFHDWRSPTRIHESLRTHTWSAAVPGITAPGRQPRSTEPRRDLRIIGTIMGFAWRFRCQNNCAAMLVSGRGGDVFRRVFELELIAGHLGVDAA